MSHSLRVIAAAAFVVVARMAAAQAFAPGEETVLQFRYLNVPSGEGKMTVGQPAGDVWPIMFQARTIGLAGFLDIREHLVSYWDATARTSRGFDLRAYEVGDYHQDTARFDRLNRKATFERQRKDKKTTKTFEIPADVHDITSAVMWLRLQPLEPGHRFELPVVSGSKQFVMVAEVVARERVETPAGTFDALKLKVRTGFAGNFSTSRDSFVWLSDDPRHVLVRFTADFKIGSLVATLKSYRPGTQVARR
jgi:hypothetical protein